MKKIALLLFSSLLLVNCSKDSNDETPQSIIVNNGNLKKIEEIQNGFIIKTSDYTYNDVGNISKLIINDGSKIYETTFNYNVNNIMISWNLHEYYISNPSSQTNQTNTLEYTDGKITNVCINRIIDSFSTPIQQADKILYTYDSGLLPISIKHYTPQSSIGGNAPTCSDVIYEDNEELFTYTNGNTTKYSSGSTTFSNDYNIIEYDTKNNPLSKIKPDAFKYSIGRSTKNNMTKIYVHDATNNSLQGTDFFENTYDSNNFLIKAIESYYPVGSSNPTITTINYYYY